jgi:hypothetical protein
MCEIILVFPLFLKTIWTTAFELETFLQSKKNQFPLQIAFPNLNVDSIFLIEHKR